MDDSKYIDKKEKLADWFKSRNIDLLKKRVSELRDSGKFDKAASVLKEGVSKYGSAVSKAIPALGIASSLMSKDSDAEDNIPILKEASPLGPSKGSDEFEFESPSKESSDSDRKKLIKKLLDKYNSSSEDE